MPDFLGIDTSNYTTSVAVYNSDNSTVTNLKMLLPVKEGEIGLRQSDAVFFHTKQLPMLISRLKDTELHIKGIGVSTRPRNVNGSYMPCFTVGEGLAESLSYLNKYDIYKTSHQVGHILATLYSCGKLSFVKSPFLAFHVSGGTTDCLLVTPDSDEIIKASLVATSLDLKAGQAVDRIGASLGLHFPCGKELEKLADASFQLYNPKVYFKDNDCSLSGLQNQCSKMLLDGELPCDIAKYCLDFIYTVIYNMTTNALSKYGDLNIIYAGGVMSNSIIRKKITEKFPSAFFAKPEFSCDNAVGAAVFAYLKGSM